MFWYSVLCSSIGLLLCSTYSIMGMAEHTPQLIMPDNVCEQIMSYLPADNYARVYWSRYRLCSQEFYTSIVQAFLACNYVPREFIDKIIARNFATFSSKTAGKPEFQERIKRALLHSCAIERDTQDYQLFKCSLKELHSLKNFIEPDCAVLLTQGTQELHEYFVQLKSCALLKQVLQMARRQRSQAVLYRESIQEHVRRHGSTSARIYFKALEFFDPFDYRVLDIKRAGVYFAYCTIVYSMLAILACKAYAADQAELSSNTVLTALKPSCAFLFFGLPVIAGLLGTLGVISMIIELSAMHGALPRNYIRYGRFLLQVSRRLEAVIVQAKMLT